ncbi:protein YLS9 [Tripterygium wilfordii]|uniref:Protein YLS9 n=1 Tax=Tripterygium wilfordii TaxID=458696 RepID=A0A7J7DZF6_TRIWF|nr:NDR1/HIN1-like protein 1 [Tripterygium wilfordii]KAF5751697.1 protein YLS9 [Tripterygium wilfordii]
MCVKKCGHYETKRERLCRRIVSALLAITIIMLIIIFLVWIILRPTKPRFILQDATLYSLNISGPNVLTTSLQVSVSSRNPNERIGIYYEKLDIYASYRNQQITLPTAIPNSYQGHEEITVWSPFLNGESVPVSLYLSIALGQDQNTGHVLVNIKIQGNVKWKVGSWVSGNYRMDVNCPAFISSGEPNKGIEIGPATKYQFVQDCHVDV